MPVKYDNPGNPMLTVQINHTYLPNTLVDLGATTNVMTTRTLYTLGLPNPRPTPTVLELGDRSIVKPLGVLEDIIIVVDSWEYPVEFLVLNIQSKLDGHPLILGRPWLATTDAYIKCRYGNMLISNGSSKKSLVFYPPAMPSLLACPKEALEECPLCVDYEEEYEEVRPVLTIGKALRFQNENEDETIDTFINCPNSAPQSAQTILETIMDCDNQKDVYPKNRS